MRTLGRYALLRNLSEDERVWEAELLGPAGFRKRVAVELLDEAALDAVRGAGMLHHPNLVEVYEVEEADGQWFCAMELVRGGALLERAPLPPRAVVEAGLQLCTGLQAREGTGWLHPLDVLVDEGVVKVHPVGRTGGLPRGWRPPEARPGPRADVWSAGAVLQVLATGSRDGAAEAGLLTEVVARCLETDPEARYPDVEALGAALETVEAVGPGLADVCAGLVAPDVPVWSRARSNLPPTPTLVGREALLRDLAHRLAHGRLVTLKGAPGIGKSAVALALAHQRLQAGAVEAWWVDPEQGGLEAALRRAAGVVGEVGMELAGRGELVLVIDGLEGRPEAARQLSGWLGEAPGLRVVVASREPLRLPGEQVVEVPPLDAESARALVGEGPDAEARLAASGGVPGALVGQPDALDARLDALGQRLEDWGLAALGQLADIGQDLGLDEAEAAIDVDAFPDAPWALDVVADLVERSVLCPVAGPDGDSRFRVLEPVRRWVRSRRGMRREGQEA